MDRANVARVVIEMLDRIEMVIGETVGSLTSEFEKSEGASNEQANNEYEMHQRLGRHIVAAMLNKTYKKLYDKSKDELDNQLAVMGLDYLVNPGEERVLFENRGFKFIKKRHKSSEVVALDDFKIELAKAGVEPEVVSKALEEASKEKRGSVFYDVEPV